MTTPTAAHGVRIIAPTRRARGHIARVGGRSPRVAIGFDAETLKRISDMAAKRHVSFSQIVRELVAKGLAS